MCQPGTWWDLHKVNCTCMLLICLYASSFSRLATSSDLLFSASVNSSASILCSKMREKLDAHTCMCLQ